MAAGLAPVVDDVGVRVMVGVLVRLVHGHAEPIGSLAAGQHLPVGVPASRVDPGDDAGRASPGSKALAGVEEPPEALRCTSSGPGRPELDIAEPASRRGSRPHMTHAEGDQLGAIQDEHRVAEVLGANGVDLAAHVQPLEDRAGHPCSSGVALLGIGERRAPSAEKAVHPFLGPDTALEGIAVRKRGRNP